MCLVSSALSTSRPGSKVIPTSLLYARDYHSSLICEAGHNRWSKIGRKKAIADIKRSTVIQKFRNQIVTAVRTGKSADVDSNARLASVIDRAKDAGISKTSIEAAIAHAGTKEAGGEVIVYEGRSDDGYMLLIEVMTVNKNRTRPVLRKCLKDHGWVFICMPLSVTLGNACMWFKRVGVSDLWGKNMIIIIKKLPCNLVEYIASCMHIGYITR